MNEDAGRQLLGLIRENLYTPVVRNILDKFGYTKQFLPNTIRPMESSMKIVGRAMPVLVVPREVEAEVIKLALGKVSTEKEIFVKISEGMSATDAFAKYGVL